MPKTRAQKLRVTDPELFEDVLYEIYSLGYLDNFKEAHGEEITWPTIENFSMWLKGEGDLFDFEGAANE